MKYKSIFFWLVLLIPLIFSQAPAAWGEEAEENPWERFSINLGGFITSLNSDVRIGSSTLGVGIDINLEEALDMDSTTEVFRGEMLYRFGKSRRHRVDLNYLNLRRNAVKALERDIEFQDQLYTVGTTVESYFNIEIIKGQYSYSLFQDDRFDLAAGLGVYVMPIETGLYADGVGSRSESITAPLPVLTLRNDFAFTPQVFLRQSIDLFYLEIDDFEGLLTDAKIALEYNPWKHVGFGMALDNLRLRIRANGEDYPSVDFRGDIKFSYFGVMLYAKYFF